MSVSDDGLRALGALIRACRTVAGLTQTELGQRAGIVGKYVSEIERGTRDIPFSTLRAIAEDGLGLALDVRFRATQSSTDLTRSVDEVARAILDLAPEQRARVLSIVRILLRLAAD